MDSYSHTAADEELDALFADPHTDDPEELDELFADSHTDDPELTDVLERIALAVQRIVTGLGIIAGLLFLAVVILAVELVT